MPSETATIAFTADEVRTLHRFLYDRKVNGPEDEFYGSPLLASAQRKILACLREIDPTPEWNQWTEGRSHRSALEKARRYLRRQCRTAAWQSFSSSERRAFVEDILSPLAVDEPLLAELVDRGDR